MSAFVLLAWCKASDNVPGPRPSLAVLAALKARAAERLSRAAERPIAVACDAWRRPDGLALPAACDFLARMTIEAEPGASARSFASWFEWRHPVWCWTADDFPRALALELVSDGPPATEAAS